MTEKEFTQSFDGLDWAKGFVATMKEQGYHVGTPDGVMTEADVEGWLHTWFANAIMRGYDEYPRRNPIHEWLSIQTAPRDGRHFLAATKFMGEPCVEAIWWADGRWNGAQGEQRFDAWMPLPDPPPAGETTGGPRGQ